MFGSNKKIGGTAMIRIYADSTNDLGAELNDYVKTLYAIARSEGAEAMTVCAKLEEEGQAIDCALFKEKGLGFYVGDVRPKAEGGGENSPVPDNSADPAVIRALRPCVRIGSAGTGVTSTGGAAVTIGLAVGAGVIWA